MTPEQAEALAEKHGCRMSWEGSRSFIYDIYFDRVDPELVIGDVFWSRETLQNATADEVIASFPRAPQFLIEDEEQNFTREMYEKLYAPRMERRFIAVTLDPERAREGYDRKAVPPHWLLSASNPEGYLPVGPNWPRAEVETEGQPPAAGTSAERE